MPVSCRAEQPRCSSPSLLFTHTLSSRKLGFKIQSSIKEDDEIPAASTAGEGQGGRQVRVEVSDDGSECCEADAPSEEQLRPVPVPTGREGAGLLSTLADKSRKHSEMSFGADGFTVAQSLSSEGLTADGEKLEGLDLRPAWVYIKVWIIRVEHGQSGEQRCGRPGCTSRCG